VKVGNHSAQESGSRFRRAHDLDTDSDYERQQAGTCEGSCNVSILLKSPYHMILILYEI